MLEEGPPQSSSLSNLVSAAWDDPFSEEKKLSKIRRIVFRRKDARAQVSVLEGLGEAVFYSQCRFSFRLLLHIPLLRQSNVSAMRQLLRSCMGTDDCGRDGRTDGRAMLQKRLKKVEILLHENRNYRFNIQMKSRTVVHPGVTHKKLQRQQFGLREKTYAGSFTLCNTLPCTYYVVRASP